VDDHVEWLKSRPNHTPTQEMEYRRARSLEQIRVAEDLRELHFMAGVLLVDAEGHGVISAKIASTVHDTSTGILEYPGTADHGQTAAVFSRQNRSIAVVPISERDVKLLFQRVPFLGRIEAGNVKPDQVLPQNGCHFDKPGVCKENAMAVVGSVCEGPACAAVPSYEVRVIKDQVEIKLWR